MLEIQSLSKVYPNGTHALDSFTLTVAQGEPWRSSAGPLWKKHAPQIAGRA